MYLWFSSLSEVFCCSYERGAVYVEIVGDFAVSQFTDKCQGFCQKLFTYTYGVDSRLSVPHSAGERADKFGDLQRENFIPKKSRVKNNTNQDDKSRFVLFRSGAEGGT